MVQWRAVELGREEQGLTEKRRTLKRRLSTAVGLRETRMVSEG